MKTKRCSVAVTALLALHTEACSDFFGEPRRIETGNEVVVGVFDATDTDTEASVGSVAVGTSAIHVAVFAPQNASPEGSSWTVHSVPTGSAMGDATEIFRREGPESQGGRGHVATDGDGVFVAIATSEPAPQGPQPCVLFVRGTGGTFVELASLLASDPSMGGSCGVAGLAAGAGGVFVLVEQQSGGPEAKAFSPYSGGCCGAPTASGTVYALTRDTGVARVVAAGRSFAQLVETPILVDESLVYWLEESAESGRTRGSITMAPPTPGGAAGELFAASAGERPTAFTQSDDALFLATTLSTNDSNPFDSSLGCLVRRIGKTDGRATEIHRDAHSICMGLAVSGDTTYAVTWGEMGARGERSTALVRITEDGTPRAFGFERADLYPREVLAGKEGGLLVIGAWRVLGVDDTRLP